MPSSIKKQKTCSQLKKQFWKVFSQYIRKRDKGQCISCGIIKDYREQDAGHYVNKSICGIELYFHPQNVHAQCRACNYYRRGNLSLYALALQNKYGPKILEQLEVVRKLSRGAKWSREIFKGKIEEYKEKLKELRKQDA